MANLENLKPFTSEQSHEEAVKNGRKGGIQSGKSRRHQKSLKNIADMLGGLEIKSEKDKQALRDFGVTEEDLINDTVAMYQLTMQAMKGDAKANELLAKLRGQFKEQTSVEVAEVKPLVDLTKRRKNGEDNGSQ